MLIYVWVFLGEKSVVYFDVILGLDQQSFVLKVFFFLGGGVKKLKLVGFQF